MQELQPGQNRPVGSGRVSVGVAGEPPEVLPPARMRVRCCWPPTAGFSTPTTW
ncbi:MAG: hypothetical protein R3F40_02435 [Candidatus Competibacteraceae bacterium]